MTRRKSGCVSGEAFHAMSRNATRASRRYGLHSAGTFLHGNAGSEKKRGSEFQSDPLLAFIPLSGTSPAAPAARHGTVAAFRAPHGPLRSAKSTSGVCPLRPIFVSRIPCPPPTGSPSTYSNRSAGASPQSRPTRVPHAVRGSRATLPRHRQAIFPLETLFELGDRARHFAYAAERIHRTISTDTPRSPF